MIICRNRNFPWLQELSAVALPPPVKVVYYLHGVFTATGLGNQQHGHHGF